MEEFDLYGDLELLHAEEKQKTIEDLKWKDKYKVALITIEKLQAENKDLKKKVKQLETNFASLFDTARTEIKRKDNLICELRKQKDDICFRRSKPQFAGRQLNENADVCRAASSESVHLNPFSRQPRKANPPNSETSKQLPNEKLPQTCENSKRKHVKDNSRERDPRDVSHERDESRDRDRRRHRSRDRSRHRNRSRDRIDEGSRHRYVDRNNSKDRDQLKEDPKRNMSKDRASCKDEKKDNKKRKRHGRDASQTRGSDSSCEKNANTHCRSQQMNYTNENESKVSSNRYESKKIEEKPKDVGKSDSDQIIDSKTELNQLKNVPSPNSEKRVNSKIEILQIEILKDVKEFKKNKLKADKIPKPDPIDPVVVTTEKSNQFLDALFDDSVINDSEEPDDDLYDDLSVSKQQLPVSVPEDIKKQNYLEKDVNYNLNFHTPQRSSNAVNLLDDLFGPSPAGSLCPLVTRQDSVKSTGGSSSDSDFVLITKSARSPNGKITQLTTTPKVPLDDICSQSDESINKEHYGMKPPKNPMTIGLNQTDSSTDKKKFVKIDENSNFKQQTPQKQVGSKLMDDLFGQSPSSSICSQKNSVRSMNESSNDCIFEPNLKSANREDEEKHASTSSKTPIIIHDNFIKCNENIEAIQTEQIVIPCSTQNDARAKIADNGKTFKFVELDSSFYSSEDEINDNLSEKCNTSRVEVESPLFENITPLKKIEAFETELNHLTNKSEVQSNILTTSDEKLSDLNCVQDIILENVPATCESTFNNQTKKDYFEKASRPEKPRESENCRDLSEKNKKRGELCKNDDSKKRSISSKDSVSKSTSEENQHRSRCSRSEKEKRRHHHNHHHHRKHKDQSQESTYSKGDSSLHSNSKKHRRYERQDKIGTDNYNKPDSTSSKNDVSKARSSPMLVYYDDDSVKDASQNLKVTDQDQVFFLHCDDISSDEEIIGAESYSRENKGKSNKEEKTTVDELKLNRSICEISNEIESNKKITDSFDANDNNIASKQENRMGIGIEAECNISPLKPGVQNEDLALQHVAKEISSPRIEENIFDAVCSSVGFVKKSDTCDLKTNTTSTNVIVPNCPEDVDVQQSSKDNLFHSTKSASEKENILIEIRKNQNAPVETINIDEIDDNQIPANHKNEQVTHESPNKTDGKVVLDKGSDGIPNVCSLEVDLNNENIYNNEDKTELPSSMSLLQSTSHHGELNKSLNVSDKEQSNTEDNDKISTLNNDEIGKGSNLNTSCNIPLSNEASESNFEQTFKNEKPSSDRKFKMRLEEQPSIENSSDCQQLTIDPVQSAQEATLPKDEHCEANSHGITHLNLSNQSENLQKITVASPEANKEKGVSRQITDQTLRDKKHSAERFSSYVSPQKLHNSTDEFESSHSNSESVSTGRRKKIKTPRKRTDVCIYKDGSNGTTMMVSDRYAKCNDAQTSSWVQSESDLISPEVSFKPISPNKGTDNFEGNKTIIEKNPERPSYDELNGIFENVKETQTPKSSPKEIYESRNKNSENNGLSSSPSEKKLKSTKEPLVSLPKSDDISVELSSNILLRSDQEKENLEMDEDSPPKILPSSTTRENQVKDVSRKFQETKSVHKKGSTLIDAEKGPPLDAVVSQANFSNPISELNEIEKKEDELNEKIIETCSITIKRNRNKRKNIINSVENVEAMPNEVKNTTHFCGESVKEPLTFNIGTEKNNKNNKEFGKDCDNCDYLQKTNDEASDKICSSSAALISAESADHQPNEQQQMMKHFMDSEYSLVGTCNYPSATYLDEVLETRLEEKRIQKRKLKINTSVDNSHCELKKKSTKSPTTCEAKKVNVKRKYKKKSTQILDSPSSNEDVDVLNGIKSEESKVLSNDADENQEQLSRPLDEPCNYLSVTNSDEVVNTKQTETNVKKRKLKSKTNLKNPEAELKANASETYDALKSMVKNKYNKKSKQFLDSSNCNEDIQVKSIIRQESKIVSNNECEIKNKEKALKHLKSTEPTKKRKYKRINLNSSSDSTDKSDEFKETPSSSINCEKILDKIHIPHLSTEKVDEISHYSRETTNIRLEKSSSCVSGEKELNHAIDLPVHNSLPEDEKEDSCNIKHKKTKRHRKRKLSRSSDTKSDQVTVQSKRSKNTLENSSQSSIEPSCPVSGEKNHQESIKQSQRSPRSCENSVSIALTPTHHKIFLNDVFPNDPPPVYNANDDDHQYHEIDDRLRSMFQSPSYTQSSNVEIPTYTKNDDINATNEGNVTIEETLNQSENILIDETLNQSERTKCDTSAGSRKVSLGSNEYVIESIGSHSANVFITRKKSKKRTKVVATAV